jgi:hypothetical protein
MHCLKVNFKIHGTMSLKLIGVYWNHLFTVKSILMPNRKSVSLVTTNSLWQNEQTSVWTPCKSVITRTMSRYRITLNSPDFIRRMIMENFVNLHLIISKIKHWNVGQKTCFSHSSGHPSIHSALQPWVSLGLLDNQSPLLPVLCLLRPPLYSLCAQNRWSYLY